MDAGGAGKDAHASFATMGDKRDAEQHGDAGNTVGCGFTGHVDGGTRAVGIQRHLRADMPRDEKRFVGKPHSVERTLPGGLAHRKLGQPGRTPLRYCYLIRLRYTRP